MSRRHIKSVFRHKISYDPSMTDSGVLANDLSVTDEYFKNTDSDTHPYDFLDNILDELTDIEKSCVEMCVMQNMTYTEASRILGCSDQTARRASIRGVNKIKDILKVSSWLPVINEDLPNVDDSSEVEEVSFDDVLKTFKEVADEQE